jgi:hypothetical protein
LPNSASTKVAITDNSLTPGRKNESRQIKMPTPIPTFLLPRGPPSTHILRTLQHQPTRAFSATRPAFKKANANANSKPRVLEKPDKFRPPSHPQRYVAPSPKNAPPGQPFEYGPRTTPKQIEEQNTKQYPNMFPPEGTVMHKFLTSKWIHIWIAMVSYPHLNPRYATLAYTLYPIP